MAKRNRNNRERMMGGLPPNEDERSQFPMGGLPPNEEFPMGGLPPNEEFPMGELPPDMQLEPEDVNMFIKQKLQDESRRPMGKPIKRIKSDKTQISELIKPLEQIIQTGEILDDNVIIQSNDRGELDMMADMLAFNPFEVKEIAPKPVDGNVLTDEDRRRLFMEEEKRRMISDERFEEFQRAIAEDAERRDIFKEEIRIMKEDFQIWLEKNFPKITGGKNVDVKEIPKIERENKLVKKEIVTRKANLQKNKVDRLSNEKKRKKKESEFKINKIGIREIQTFFEEDILIEQREKLSKNPELEGLNDIQTTIKEMKEMELRLGRPIVPHRDIVESEESDFDTKSYTTTDDILIKPEFNRDREGEIRKEMMLKELRYRLEPNRLEEDFIDNKN